MNLSDYRPLISQAVIGLAVTIGAYMLLVDPPRARLATQRAGAIAPAQQLRKGEGLQSQIANLTQAVQRTQAESARISELGRPARDERNLFASLMTLAESCNVRIDELNPSKIAPRPAPPIIAGAPEGPPPVAPVPGDVAVGYSMTAIASYGDIARFVRAIRTDMGYAAVRKVRLLPVLDPSVKAVRAVIETEHFSFAAAAPDPSSVAGQTAAVGDPRP